MSAEQDHVCFIEDVPVYTRRRGVVYLKRNGMVCVMSDCVFRASVAEANRLLDEMDAEQCSIIPFRLAKAE